ncbi:ABC transporter substrate-binding protein [Paracandidimonas soli]|uniref:Amino acid ABC transporter substrate-binding protein (PAAT family) n=1 Tax=Paracandidimonas soli TaxID=1917182 RepID=A0A4R3UWK3_9BURK|nr:ABC transporter substrate-binding protein [Paracandidimonas soli]TCU95163.1 amino acid ABC transporter substrate-binding protein (PAAT family) [Paracandidimonas soli]
MTTSTIDPSLLQAFAPTGVLRASINVGNPILAGRNPQTQEPFGVSIDLARELAGRLGVDLKLVVWESAGESVQAATDDIVDIGFFAIDPKRGESVAFTPPYILIEGAYLVADGSPLQSNEEVDKEGTTVTVGKGSAYDLYLSRTLKNASIERAPTSPAVVSYYLEHGHDVAAGVRQQLEADAAKHAGLRLLPSHFMVIRQAMGMNRSRGEAAIRYLSQFVEEMKASGFVAQAMKRHGIQGAAVAPAEAQA